jgi:hypothetical protein
MSTMMYNHHQETTMDTSEKLLIGFITMIALGFGALIVNDTFGVKKREIITVKVVNAEVRKPSKSSTRYVYFTLEKDGYRWESNERIEYARCPSPRYNVDAAVWIDTHTGFLTGRSSSNTSGMITFCQP